MASSALFEGYEKEYQEFSAAITRKTATVSSTGPNERRGVVAEVEGDITRADELLKGMDLEARSLPATAKAPLMAKLRDYKNDLSKLKRQLKEATSSAAANSNDARRADLLSRAELGDANVPTSGAQRQRLLDTTDTVNRTGERIQEGKRTLLETEELGVSILQNLHTQRQTIVHARDTLHGADDHLAKSRRILSVMSRRAMMNKAILFGVILMLIGCIGTIIYFKFGR